MSSMPDPQSQIPSPQSDQLRRSIYTLLIVLGTGAMLGRILAVDSVDKLAIQQARVDAARAQLDGQRARLEESGVRGDALQQKLDRYVRKEKLWTRAQVCRPFLSANDRSRWCTVRALVEERLRVEGHPYAIDKVIQEPGWDTIDMVKHEGHLYSSKPPLLPTMMAGEYWLIRRLSGMTLGTESYWIGRFMLITVNLLPLVVYFLLLARVIDRLGTSDWGRLLVMATATFGTFLTTFAVTINNHLPAAVSAMVTLYAIVRICVDGRRQWRYFLVAGLFGAFTAANELPAAALLAAAGALLLWKAPWRTLAGFVPGAIVVGAAFFGTNWLAHGNLRPAYLHRSSDDNWYDYTYQRGGQTYESYWNHPVGVDRGEPSAAIYAANILVGHHGIFSLTPLWLLSAAGVILWLRPGQDRNLRELALLIGLVSLVCLAFYLTRPLEHRNYGGVTSGLRWMFWFAPLWLVAMVPAADVMAGRRWTRGVALAMLLVSVLSASYPTWNPWTHPWIMNYLHYLGWGA